MAEIKGELLYGAHAVAEALKAKKRKLIAIYTTKPEPKSFLRVKQFLPASKNFNLQYVSRDVLAKMAGGSDHMGIVAWFSEFQYRKKFFEPEKHKKLLLLDGVQDVRNLGAITRSAYCTGFDGLILCASKSAAITPAAVKASAGLVEHLDVFLAPNTSAALDLLNSAGYNKYFAVLGEGKLINEVKFENPFCLIIGNEEQGVGKQHFNKGTLVTLPQKTKDISYNASVAAGIFMFYCSFINK